MKYCILCLCVLKFTFQYCVTLKIGITTVLLSKVFIKYILFVYAKNIKLALAAKGLKPDSLVAHTVFTFLDSLSWE